MPSLQKINWVSTNRTEDTCQLTQILNILVSSQHQCTLLFRPSIQTSFVGFVDNYAIRRSCCNKSETIRSLSPSGIEVEGDVGEEVSEDRKEEGQMSARYQRSVILEMSKSSEKAGFKHKDRLPEEESFVIR